MKANEKQNESKILAKRTHTEEQIIEQLLNELEENGVFSRDEDGVIFSRRLVREAEISRIRSEAGRIGGRPSLKKEQKQNESKMKANEKQNESKTKANIKQHVKAPSASASASASEYASDNGKIEERKSEGRKEGKKEEEKQIGDIISRWNNFANRYGLAKVEFIKPGTTRYQKLKARLKEKHFDFDSILNEISNSTFLLGGKPGVDWRVTFDWLICPSNYPKILEGNYRDQKTFQVGENREEDDHPPGYWEKVRELKEKGLAGEALMTELQKIYPGYFGGGHEEAK